MQHLKPHTLTHTTFVAPPQLLAPYQLRRLGLRTLAITATFFLFAVSAAGGTSAFEWVATIQTFVDEITGPTAYLIIVIGFAAGGVLFIFTRFERAGLFLIQVMVGGTIIVFASEIADAFGFTGALI